MNIDTTYHIAFTKTCPVCEGEMHKDCDADEVEWWWQCQMCDHREKI